MNDSAQLVDDKALEAMMRDSCDAARGKRVVERGGSSVDQVADGVRKFQMGSVPDRGGRESSIYFKTLNPFETCQTHRCC